MALPKGCLKKKSGRFGHAELEVFRRNEEGEVEQTGGYAT